MIYLYTSKYHSDYMITMKDIVREGNKALHQPTQDLTMPPSEEDKEILTCMMNFLKNSQDIDLAEKYKLRPGVGLSANQIGLNKRMFVAYLTDEKGMKHEYTLINPKIISHSVSMIYLSPSEGCLSVDRDLKGFVPRYERVKVKGYASIVIQHEIDHLNGIMFYERMNKENPFEIPENCKRLY